MSDFDNFDDLDAVRDFRSLAEPFPGAVDASVRQRIFDLAAVRGYRPGAAAPGPSRPAGPARRSPGAGRPGAPTEVVDLADRGRVRTRRHHRSMVAVSVGLVVVVLTAGVLFKRSSTGEHLEIGGPAAAGEAADPATVLSVDGLQALVAGQPDRPLAPGVFEHRVTEQAYLAGATGTETDPATPGQMRMLEVSQRWAAADRTGREVTQVSRAGTAETPQYTELPLPAERAFGGLSYRFLRDLAPVPAVLPDQIVAELSRRRASVSSDVEGILGVLTERVVRPEVRAGLVRCLVGKGLTSRGPTVDAKGRPGHGFTLTATTDVWTLIVDGAGTVLSWERAPRDTAPMSGAFVIVATETVERLPDS